MKILRRSFLFASLMGAIAVGHTGTAGATTWSVCPNPADGCDFTTIQAGINAASPLDIVEVGTPGRTTPDIYYENIVMKDGVSVVSEGSNTATVQYIDDLNTTIKVGTADVVHESTILERTTLTIIHGSGNTPVVTFDTVANTVLDGFIVENIDSTAADHIYLVKVEDSSPTIQNNIIRDNEGLLHNGGISVKGINGVVTPLIQKNVIHYVDGPGVCVNSQAVPDIRANEIFTTPSVGPGFSPGIGLRDDAAATIIGNHIFENGGGGIGSREYGLSNSGFPLVIQGNVIHMNHGDNSENFAAGVIIYGQVGAGVADQIDITIGGPNLEDRNEIYANMVGVRLDINGTDNFRMGSAVIENNYIHNNRKPGLHLSDVSNVTVTNNTVTGNRVGLRFNYIDSGIIEGNEFSGNKRGGLAFYNSLNTAQDITINDNDINTNGFGGIRMNSSSVTGTISNNRINNNTYGGIMFERSGSTFEITNNEINNNGRGGIHTGREKTLTGADTSTIFTWYNALPLVVTIRGNKVHHNGSGDFGGGIDVRHATGTIENNLVYKNQRGGIRFFDYITEITHNTVAGNGVGGYGGGIIYDDMEGSVNSMPSGYMTTAIPIENNILYDNYYAGVVTGGLSNFDSCLTVLDSRDYNIYAFNNFAGECDLQLPFFQLPCLRMQLGMCDFPSSGEIFLDPEFVDYAADDYHLLATSPAIDTGDPTFPNDVSIPPGEGTVAADMGAYGGQYGIDW